MRPYQAFHVLDAIRRSAVVRLRRKGVELSLDDSQTVLDVYQQWLMLMMDLGYLHPETLERDARRLWSDMIKVDVLDLNNAFAECLQLVRVKTSKGFKALCSKISSHLYNHVKADIELILQGDVLAAKRLTQAFAYTGRLSLKDIDLTQQLLEEYLAIEDKIVDDYPGSLIRSLNVIMRRWIGTFGPEEMFPHHGPGGVAGLGRTSYEIKYKNLTTDKLLQYAFGDPDWITNNGPLASLARVSATVFVPKSYKTFRTISMEPATLMYLQQGVWGGIDSLVRSSKYLSARIEFHDQERNKALARKGSIDRDYATLDLSAASDSVSYSLVKKVFKGTWLLRYLVALRSQFTLLPDGRYVKLKKFAPMGSALCFPIETLIFAAICEHVTRGLGVSGDFSVYGDDIIVPTHCAEEVMSVLATLGFTVNRSKSFYQSTCWFRESCGGEYFDGYDATPLRVSRGYASTERDVRLDELVELANSAYDRGFRFLRYFFIKKLEDEGLEVYFAPTSLRSDNYTNYHLKKRWNPDLQVIEVRAHAQAVTYGEGDLELLFQDDRIRYHHWLVMTANRKVSQARLNRTVNRNYRAFLKAHHHVIHEENAFESVICRSLKVMKRTWRTKYYEELDQLFIASQLGDGKFLPS